MYLPGNLKYTVLLVMLSGGCDSGGTDDDVTGDDDTTADDDATGDDDTTPADDDTVGDDDTFSGSLLILEEDLTLIAAEGPFSLSQDVYIPPGITVTLTPATVLQLYPEVSVYVEGTLLLEGEPGAEVQLVRATAFGWGGLQFASKETSEMSYVMIEGGSVSIRSGLPAIADASFENANITVYDGFSLEIDRSSFTVTDADSAHLNAVYAPEGGSLTLRDVDILGHHGGVVLYGAGAMEETLTLSRVTVSQSGWMGVAATEAHLDIDSLVSQQGLSYGIYATDCDGVVRNSYLSGNATAGIFGNAGSVNLDLESCDITNNIGYGLYYVGVVRGCYVAGNAGNDPGELEVVTAPGVEDEIQDAGGTQTWQADAILDPSDQPVTLGPG